ncbi:hypothetical protein [Saccharopolyspora phatthalungensis]|uniref:Uncharacterized protein n=1 Tax=Saccharopolyspora phatthalungensis TaxID=664693 RepID=A0A840QA67_9PSEU|nr:hypothetical protein [Saccharopolyspora phatthalungensis]MBB5155325.1 hypothetical protein [Saccharopolyspora phatthalungensis]
MNARIDLAIIAGLSENPNDRTIDDQTTSDTESAHSRPDRFPRHLARLLAQAPWAAVRARSSGRLRPCGCHGKPDHSRRGFR